MTKHRSAAGVVQLFGKIYALGGHGRRRSPSKSRNSSKSSSCLAQKRSSLSQKGSGLSQKKKLPKKVKHQRLRMPPKKVNHQRLKVMLNPAKVNAVKKEGERTNHSKLERTNLKSLMTICALTGTTLI